MDHTLKSPNMSTQTLHHYPHPLATSYGLHQAFQRSTPPSLASVYGPGSNYNFPYAPPPDWGFHYPGLTGDAYFRRDSQDYRSCAQMNSTSALNLSHSGVMNTDRLSSAQRAWHHPGGQALPKSEPYGMHMAGDENVADASKVYSQIHHNKLTVDKDYMDSLESSNSCQGMSRENFKTN